MVLDQHESGSPSFPPLAIEGGPPGLVDGPPGWPLRDQAVRAQLIASWESGDWGRYEADSCELLCQRLREMHGVAHALLCCSGTMAVELALRGVGVRSGDEVILAGYDFPGNFRAIEAIGARPVLVDVQPHSWGLDPSQLPHALSAATRAIVVSHLHGGLANMQQIVAVARQAGVPVIEDACQAPGGQVQGRICGTWGDVGVLSFGGSKLLTAGRGGALVTDDAAIHQRAKIYGERGNEAFPLSGLQAAVLLPQLDMLDQRNQIRRDNVRRLADACRSHGLLHPIDPTQQPGQASYYKFALQFHAERAKPGVSRATLLAALLAEGMAVGPGFRGFARRSPNRCRVAGTLEHATSVAQRTILLHHPVLLEAEPYIAKLASTLAKIAYWLRQPVP